MVGVVFTINSPFPLPPAAKVTLAGFMLQTGRSCAPAGEPARVQVIFMVPEYVLLADRFTTVAALEPGGIAAGVGTVITTWETVTTADPIELMYVASPA
jgi:hypothetical protein